MATVRVKEPGAGAELWGFRTLWEHPGTAAGKESRLCPRNSAQKFPLTPQHPLKVFPRFLFS